MLPMELFREEPERIKESERRRDKDPSRVDEVREIETEDVKEMLGIELSPVRVKCAVLGLKVLEGGIVEYEKEN